MPASTSNNRDRTDPLVELIFRVLADPLPRSGVDAAYLMAPTADSVGSVVGGARRLVDRGLSSKILYAGCSPISGYPGAEKLAADLIDGGLPVDVLVPVDMQHLDVLHTLSESERIAEYARDEKLDTLCVVTAPFHQLRAYMTMVTVFEKLHLPTRVYSFAGDPQPWNHNAVHSQGLLADTRVNLIRSEMERLVLYHRKGDLAGVQDILKYLDDRDQPKS